MKGKQRNYRGTRQPCHFFGKTIYWGTDHVWHVFVYWGQKKKGSEQTMKINELK